MLWYLKAGDAAAPLLIVMEDCFFLKHCFTFSPFLLIYNYGIGPWSFTRWEEAYGFLGFLNWRFNIRVMIYLNLKQPLNYFLIYTWWLVEDCTEVFYSLCKCSTLLYEECCSICTHQFWSTWVLWTIFLLKSIIEVLGVVAISIGLNLCSFCTQPAKPLASFGQPCKC